MDNNFDENVSQMEANNNIPLGWLIFAIGLLVFGIYYFIAYTPQISGWNQMQQYHESVK